MKRHDADEGIATLAVALSEYMRADELKQLAALTKTRLPTRKGDLAAVIMGHLEGERLRTAWQGLDELQRAAVAEVVHSSSTRFLADRFHAKYGRAPNWGSSDKYGGNRSPSPLCFFFYANGVMPDDLKERLRPFVPPPVEAEIKTLDALPSAYERPYERWNSKTKSKEKGTEELPLTVRETERGAERELLSVLRLVDAGKLAVSDKTRRASAAAIDAITAILEGGDYYPHVPPKNEWRDENAGPIRSFAWPLLIQAGGLAQLSGTRLQLTKAGRKALSEPAAETIRTLSKKWLDTTILDELSRIECVRGQTGKGKHGLTAVSARRDAVADTLAGCPAGGWIATDEFFRFMRASGSDFAVTRNAWNLYIGELQYGSFGYDGNVRFLEERYLLCLLLEYAATLGLIDVALIPPAGARGDYHSMWGRLFPIIKKTTAAVVIGVTNFVVKPRGALRLSLVATAIAGAARAAVRFAFAPLSAVAGVARPGLGLSTANVGSALPSSRPSLRLANASSGTPARPLERPAPRFVRHWVDLTHRSGATVVAEEAVATRTDWANDANATGKRDGASASMAGNALGARGGRLALSYTDFPNKAPLAISAVRLHFYVGSSLVGVTDQMVLGWRKGGGAIVLETIAGTAIISNLTTPRTYDITGSIVGWVDLDALQAIVEASTAPASLNSYSCDAVELEVVASRTDNL